MRPIDAERLKDSIKKLEAESPDIKTARIIDRTIQEIFPQIIDDEPTIEAEPVNLGKWIKGNYWDEWSCSVCHNYAYLDQKENTILPDYCPHCGAKMDGGAD